MADFQAIGGVSATLQTLLQDRMRFPPGILSPGQHLTVTVDAPPHYESEPGGAPAEIPQVNLFLYRVTENGCLKNQEIPGRGSGGAYGAPPLSLELHYLLSAYGRTSEGADIGDSKLAHFLIGNAMRVFHDHAVVTERLTREVFPVIGEPILDPRLFGEYEQVKLYLHPVSLDDLTKVWTALAQPLRLSAAYMVSVVQIESGRPRRYPRPVGEPPKSGPRIAAVTFARPEITGLRVIRGGEEHAYPYARIGDTLVVLGTGFIGAGFGLAIGEVQVPVRPVSSGRIEAVIPDSTLPDGTPIPPEQALQPGAHAARLLVQVEAMPHVGFSSNGAVFMLVPFVDHPVDLDPPVMEPRLIRVRGKRLWHEQLPGQTIIGRSVVPATAYALASPTRIDVPLPDTLPRTPVVCLVGGEASGFAPTTESDELEVRVGVTGTFHVLELAPLANLDEAARLLGPAIRGVRDSEGARYANARVTLARGGPGDARLVVVAGGLRAPVSFQNHAPDTLAHDLRLTTAMLQDGYLSGELVPFPKLSASAPKLHITIDGVAKTVALGTPPSTIAAAATALQNAIRGMAAGDPNFAATYVTVLGNQLLLLPGNGRPMAIAPVPGVDESSARELQLRVEYPVRVRVNGAESLDDEVIALP